MRRWAKYNGTLSLFEIKEHLKAARAQMWCFHDGGIKGIWVTKIDSKDNCTWGTVWGCAGDFHGHKDDAIAFYGIIEDWFRASGCKFVELAGRDGWARIFPDYHEHAVILRKQL